MIITQPTGSYRPLLPKNPSDSTSVTFTVSNASPRSDLLFQSIPPGQDFRPLNPRFRGVSEGNLIFSVSSSSQKLIDINSRGPKVGDIIEFDNETTNSDLKLSTVKKVLDIQYDLEDLDLVALGIDAETEVEVTNDATVEFYSLLDEYNSLRTSRADYEARISINDKKRVSLQKAIAAIEVISSTGYGDVLTDLKDKLEKCFDTNIELIESANQSVVEAENILEKLRKLSKVMK